MSKKIIIHVHDADNASLQKAMNAVETAQSAVRNIKVDGSGDSAAVNRALAWISKAQRELSGMI